VTGIEYRSSSMQDQKEQSQLGVTGLIAGTSLRRIHLMHAAMQPDRKGSARGADPGGAAESHRVVRVNGECRLDNPVEERITDLWDTR
jgi:hypothetical protein